MQHFEKADLKRTILILLILFCSCKEQSKTDKKVVEKVIKTDFGLSHSDFTILEFNPEWYWIFENSEPIATDLQLNEISKIEPILEKAISEHNSKLEKDSRWALGLQRYKRQYVAVINEKGEKEVWINFFCKEDFEYLDWKKELIIVNDGGNCYFNLKVKLTKGEYYDLHINGVA